MATDPTPRTSHRPTGPVTKITPDPAAWAEALRLAEGDARRCEALDVRTVIVRNQPRR
jgi:hypothetical protein